MRLESRDRQEGIGCTELSELFTLEQTHNHWNNKSWSAKSPGHRPSWNTIIIHRRFGVRETGIQHFRDRCTSLVPTVLRRRGSNVPVDVKSQKLSGIQGIVTLFFWSQLYGFQRLVNFGGQCLRLTGRKFGVVETIAAFWIGNCFNMSILFVANCWFS